MAKLAPQPSDREEHRAVAKDTRFKIQDECALRLQKRDSARNDFDPHQ